MESHIQSMDNVGRDYREGFSGRALNIGMTRFVVAILVHSPSFCPTKKTPSIDFSMVSSKNRGEPVIQEPWPNNAFAVNMP